MTMRTFADADQVLKASLPGYRSRPSQGKLAGRIEEVLGQPDGEDFQPVNLLAQAPTGTGKSLAYLIPAILSGHRTVVSATTRALQMQLTLKDLPFLEEHLGVAFTWAVLYGRGQYFCPNASMGPDAPLVLAQVLRYANATPDWDGTRDSLPFRVDPMDWAAIASDADACRDLHCKDQVGQPGLRCYAEVARRKAADSRIVVVNHALLCTDLLIKASARGAGDDEDGGTGWRRAGMLGRYGRLVIDEAHAFEKVAGESLGGRLVEGTFTSLGARMRTWAHRYLRNGDSDDPISNDTIEAVEKAANRLVMAAVDLFDPERGLPDGPLTTKVLNKAADQIVEMVGALDDTRRAWSQASLDRVNPDVLPDARKSRNKITAQLGNTASTFAQVYSADSQDGDDPEHVQMVRWVKTEFGGRGRPRREIRTCPITVAPFLRKHLFTVTPTVLVSATLAVRGKFTFIAERLGIDLYDSLRVHSPFDYQTQGLLYVARDLPDPKADRSRWLEATCERIYELLEASDGRSLVVFSSRKHLELALQRVGERIDSCWPLLVQGQAEPAELRRRFLAETDSVLFGLDTFGTGFDAPGETLSHVIIAGMPMPPPDDPLYAAQCEKINKEKDDEWAGFRRIGCPMMSISLQQWDGRGVRTETDRCVTSLLDPRFVTKAYGRQALADLHERPTVYGIEEISKFLAAA